MKSVVSVILENESCLNEINKPFPLGGKSPFRRATTHHQIGVFNFVHYEEWFPKAPLHENAIANRRIKRWVFIFMGISVDGTIRISCICIDFYNIYCISYFVDSQESLIRKRLVFVVKRPWLFIRPGTIHKVGSTGSAVEHFKFL